MSRRGQRWVVVGLWVAIALGSPAVGLAESLAGDQRRESLASRDPYGEGGNVKEGSGRVDPANPHGWFTKDVRISGTELILGAFLALALGVGTWLGVRKRPVRGNVAWTGRDVATLLLGALAWCSATAMAVLFSYGHVIQSAPEMFNLFAVVGALCGPLQSLAVAGRNEGSAASGLYTSVGFVLTFVVVWISSHVIGVFSVLIPLVVMLVVEVFALRLGPPDAEREDVPVTTPPPAG